MQWDKMDYQERFDLLTDLVEVCHMMAHWCRRHVLKEKAFFLGRRQDEPKTWGDCVACDKARRVRLAAQDRPPLSFPLSLAGFIEVQEHFKALMGRLDAAPALSKNKAFKEEVRKFLEECVALGGTANGDSSALPDLLDDAEKRAALESVKENSKRAADESQKTREKVESFWDIFKRLPAAILAFLMPKKNYPPQMMEEGISMLASCKKHGDKKGIDWKPLLKKYGYDSEAKNAERNILRAVQRHAQQKRQ